MAAAIRIHSEGARMLNHSTAIVAAALRGARYRSCVIAKIISELECELHAAMRCNFEWTPRISYNYAFPFPAIA